MCEKVRPHVPSEYHLCTDELSKVPEMGKMPYKDFISSRVKIINYLKDDTLYGVSGKAATHKKQQKR